MVLIAPLPNPSPARGEGLKLARSAASDCSVITNCQVIADYQAVLLIYPSPLTGEGQGRG